MIKQRHVNPLAILLSLAGMVAMLRLLPYFYILYLEHRQGVTAPLLVSYLPTDFYSYLAFIRQAAEEGAFCFDNRFTTESQQGVFVLVLFFLLGKIAALLSICSRDIFEISRLPLLLALTYTLWRFLNLLRWDSRQKFCAIVLILFSGGIDGAVRFFTPYQEWHENLWQFYGWNSFAAFFNPLWIWSTILLLMVLRYALTADGPVIWKQKLVLAISLTLLHFSHSYSSLIALCLIATSLLVGFSWRKFFRLLYALCLPLAIISIATVWQLSDDVYRLSASNFFGSQKITALWYPIGLGVLLPLSILGARRCPSKIVCWWILPVVLLHHSGTINGYKFLFYLHIPLVLMATPYFLHLLQNFPRLSCILLFPLLFQAPVFHTLEGWQEIRSRADIAPSIYAEIKKLQTIPASTIIAPQPIANMIPAFTPHYVFYGHWFLTIEYAEKEKLYQYLAHHPQERQAIMKQFHIDYFFGVGPR